MKVEPVPELPWTTLYSLSHWVSVLSTAAAWTQLSVVFSWPLAVRRVSAPGRSSSWEPSLGAEVRGLHRCLSWPCSFL